MRALVQRVTRASVFVGDEELGRIGPGLVVLIGVSREDADEDASYIADKTVNLRILADEEGKFNRSALDTGAELLVISQFTLYGDTRRGRRPSFAKAVPPPPPRRGRAYFQPRARPVQRVGPFGTDGALPGPHDGLSGKRWPGNYHARFGRQGATETRLKATSPLGRLSLGADRPCPSFKSPRSTAQAPRCERLSRQERQDRAGGVSAGDSVQIKFVDPDRVYVGEFAYATVPPRAR